MSPASPAALMPGFFILGAAKAGTTTLFEMLRGHPQIFMPVDKEPMFFSRDDYYGRGLDWYCKTHFAAGRKFGMRGEASPHYLYWADKVAPRIRQAYDGRDVRFLVIFRDPIQRAYSYYWNMIQEGQEDLPFLEALRMEEERLRQHRDELQYYGSMRYGYMRGGCYATQLRAFLAHFQPEQFHALLLEDLEREPAAALTLACQFLGVDADIQFGPTRRNPAAQPRSRAFQRFVREPSRAKDLVKPFLSPSLRYRVKSALRRLNLRGSLHPEMPSEALQLLKPRLQPEVTGLASLIHRDLSHWN